MKKSKLAIIKYQTLELRSKRQIPMFLAELIYDLKGDEETKYVMFLLEMSKHMLRIKGYYKMYPDSEIEAKNIIKDGLQKLGF